MESSRQRQQCSTKSNSIMRKSLVAKIDRFIQTNQQIKLSSREILKIMNLYKDWKSCFGRRRARIFSRKVLYFVLERMYWSNFEDSLQVKNLLLSLYETDGHLASIIVPRIDKCPSLEFVDARKFREYFLRHAYKQKILFDGYRLLSSEMFDYIYNNWKHPVQMAVSSHDPYLLHQMLKYGALLSYDRNYSHTSIRRFRYGWGGLMVLMHLLTEILTFNPNVLCFDDLVLKPEDFAEYVQLVRCCDLLLRDVAHWSPTLLRLERYGIRKKEVLDFIEIFSTNVLPNFRKHFIMPMDLKQACRLSIRRMINDKWLLPHGIDLLPIPKCLKEYLNLQSD